MFSDNLDNTWTCYNYTESEAPNSQVESNPQKCFKAFCVSLNKTDAQTQCKQEGGTLAQIYTEVDNTAALQAINTANCGGNYYFGAEEKDCKTNCYSYPNGCSADGCPGSFIDWSPGEPDNTGTGFIPDKTPCLTFNYPTYKVYDEICSYPSNYVCQITVNITRECDAFQCNCITPNCPVNLMKSI